MISKGSESVAVVVPCYNVENYLARCLDSLVNQTYDNFEVIMVEDCSTDDTKKIVKKYEKKYDNFRAVYNVKNGGLGNARNVGIDATKSDYICFLDSDDWLPSNFISEMHATLTANKADVSVCDVYLRYDDTTKDTRIVSYYEKPDKFGLINTPLAATSSAKLFKTVLFKELRYPVDMVNEDIPVTLAILSKYKVAYTEKTHFSYYQRQGSIQNGAITSRRLDVFKALALLKQNVGGKIDKKIWEAIVWHQVLAVYIYVFPKAVGVKHRRNLIKGFYDRAQESGVKISLNNPGLKQFMRNNKIDRVYGEKAVRYLNSRQYTKASMLMETYAATQKHIDKIRPVVWVVRQSKFAVVHPLQFSKKSVRFIKRKSTQLKTVIKKNITMADLVVAAKKQSRLSGDSPVTVVIPNYNYERYLLQRVYSILAQTQKIGEIIILDDVSSDNSVVLADEIKNKINLLVPVRTINNKKNAGTFRQWEKGFDRAKYDLIWIAEADDYCDTNFLLYALEPLKQNPEVVISYTNTGYVDKDGVLLGDVRNDIDYQQSGHWDNSYVNNGIKEAKQYSYLNNTIANVSSVVFRKKPEIDYSKLFENAREYRQAGDWVFYVNYMAHGDVAYTNKVLNYYRVHGNNVSSTTKAQDHIAEILKIQERFITMLSLNTKQKAMMKKRVDLLRKAWKA
jgi:glycosyltransferase involved in cell wall biosynthesis